MIALVVLSAKLTLYILLFLPITALIIGVIGRSLRKKSTKNQALMGKVMSSFEETLGGIRIIKAFQTCLFRWDLKDNSPYEFRNNRINRND